MKLTPKQQQMLRDIANSDGPTDYADYADSAGSALGWRNRERVLEALIKRELIDGDLAITEAGRKAIGLEVANG